MLVIAFLYANVSTAFADLPPEVYYQGVDTGVNGDDDGTDALPIGFDFTFYGNTYDEFYAASNGMITFDDYRLQAGWGDWPHYVNRSIPNDNWPNNYIAPFWDDTTAHNNLNQRVLYKTIGTAPNRMLVVQYTNVGFYDDPTPLGTFFVILYEGSNNIQFQYRYLIGDNVRAHGNSATIGLENADGTAGTQYAFNTEVLESEQVILFTPNGNGTYDISTDSYEPVYLGLGTEAAPDIPIQTTPLKGATVSTTPTFSWSAAENATSYEIRVDNNPNMGSLEIHETGITSTSFTPDSALAEDTYYWIVIAHNANDQAWSQQWNFTTSNNPPPPEPGVPLLNSPEQDETNVSLTPTFSWQAASDADEYQLIVSEQADLSAPLIDQTGILTTSFDATGLTTDTVYYWSVIASNITGSTQSSVRSFTSFHINVAPTAVDDNETVAEDSGTTSFDVLSNDSDPENDALTIDSVGTPDSGGTAVINNNQVDYTPAANFFGTETFTYTISDGSLSDVATVTVTVTAENDAPTAVNDNETVVEDSSTTSFDVLNNDSDPENDTLTIDSVGATDNGGTAVINAGQIDYTPAANFVGTETFTYTISDGNGGSDSATVTITVTESPVNDAPVANDDSDSVVEDSGTTQIDVLANDSDPDAGDTLTIDSVGATDNGGTAVLNAGQINYTPAANFSGTETFIYTISDGNGGSDTATVTITVTAVNDAPTAVSDSETVAEDSGTTSFDVLSNDSDPDSDDNLVIDSIGTPDNGGTAVINAGQIDYTPAANFFGTETFTYTISDGNGGSDSTTVTVTVTSENDSPTATDDSETVAEDSGTTAFDVLFNDSDEDTTDTLSIALVGTPDNGGTAVLNAGQIDYTPAANFFGTETFTYTISDGNGGSDSATVTVTVTEVNDVPTANDDSDSLLEDGGAIQIDVLANDADPDDSDILSISSVSTPDNGGTAVINNNQIEYAPAPTFIGTETFTYTISDGRGGSDSALVTITIYESNSNAAPNANSDSPETLEDSSIIIHVLDNDHDPNGDLLSILAVGEAENGTAVIQGNTIKYTPNQHFHGFDSITYTVTDGEFTDVATVYITVISVNDLPQAGLDSATTSAGASVIITVLENDTDPVEGSPLTIISVANPAHGAATINGTTITYTPDNGFVGTETFTYTVSDGTDTVTGTVVVTVNPYQLFIPLVTN
ncbi:Ig-like domain-containing protein [Candidatus Leptofilum sp.]|uniref:Ig-like domain-containing protein n=1 Tax=Candidatus Leptofilum sp. TaxID=3241576 RepID=UPI003B5B5FA9